PYELPCWVFTHRELLIADGRIELTADDVAAVHERMRAAAGERNVWIVGGGGLAGQFAERGLLDEGIVYNAPVTLCAAAARPPRRCCRATSNSGWRSWLETATSRAGATPSCADACSTPRG